MAKKKIFFFFFGEDFTFSGSSVPWDNPKHKPKICKSTVGALIDAFPRDLFHIFLIFMISQFILDTFQWQPMKRKSHQCHMFHFSYGFPDLNLSDMSCLLLNTYECAKKKKHKKNPILTVRIYSSVFFSYINLTVIIFVYWLHTVPKVTSPALFRKHFHFSTQRCV